MGTTRREFLQASGLGAGAASLAPLGQLQAAWQGAAPRRFVFIRKSNGVRPNELSLPTFSEAERQQDKKKEAMEADLHHHELPGWMESLEPYKADMCILQGLSCKMSENGHWSYSSVMGAYKSGRNSLSGIKRASHGNQFLVLV